jgi:hypothetical protein
MTLPSFIVYRPLLPSISVHQFKKHFLIALTAMDGEGEETMVMTA